MFMKSVCTCVRARACVRVGCSELGEEQARRIRDTGLSDVLLLAFVLRSVLSSPQSRVAWGLADRDRYRRSPGVSRAPLLDVRRDRWLPHAALFTELCLFQRLGLLL